MSETTPKLDLSKVGRTNLYHSDEERRLIDEAICRTTEALQSVREEKRAINLRDEEALKSDLDRYLSARAPIERLPDNVLCTVFEFLCQDASPVAIPFYSLFIPPQVAISHVCALWRQIMLHFPAFWCSVRLESDMGMDIGNRVAVAHAWLFRAKSLPCSVEIMFENTSWLRPNQLRPAIECHTDIVKDIVSLFKLKKLDLAFEKYRLQDLLKLPHENLCYIEDLCLRQVDLRSITTSEITLPLELHKLSSLTSFSLCGSRLEISRLFGAVPEDGSRFASVPWHQLRHIKIHKAFPILFCLKILELSSVLETCSLDVYVDSSFMSSSPPSLKGPIHCNQLRKFNVDIHSPPVTNFVLGADNLIDPFLGSLRCPNLKSLTVGYIEKFFLLPPSINLRTFLRMQQISKMQLEELVICNTTRDLEVLPLPEGFPSLRRLVLPSTINFTEEAMDGLDSGSIAPFLEDLTIKGLCLC